MSADDRLAIVELVAAYAHAWDAADAEAYAALFTADAVFELFRAGSDEPASRLEGRAAILAWARERHAARPPGQQPRAHAGGTVVDEIDGDAARGRTMLLQTLTSEGEPAPRPAVTGVYRDEFRRSGGRWRFAQRTLRLDVP